MSEKVIITGSGKCGTTFMVYLLTELRLGTGYTSERMREDGARYQWNIRGEHARAESMPYIIKSPRLCLDLLDRQERWGWDIKQVYVMLRDYKHVADNKMNNRPPWPNVSEEDRRKRYTNQAANFVGNLMWQLHQGDIPYTFIMFPRAISDPEYLFKKLSFVLNGTSYEDFLVGFNKAADPSKVHWGKEES
jgi:hypothetical protein